MLYEVITVNLRQLQLALRELKGAAPQREAAPLPASVAPKSYNFV